MGAIPSKKEPMQGPRGPPGKDALYTKTDCAGFVCDDSSCGSKRTFYKGKCCVCPDDVGTGRCAAYAPVCAVEKKKQYRNLCEAERKKINTKSLSVGPCDNRERKYPESEGELAMTFMLAESVKATGKLMDNVNLDYCELVLNKFDKIEDMRKEELLILPACSDSEKLKDLTKNEPSKCYEDKVLNTKSCKKSYNKVVKTVLGTNGYKLYSNAL